jgi:hypothetical protein
MIADRIIVGNVTVEQRLLLEARELDVGLYHVLVPVILFALLPSKVPFVMRARLILLPSRHLLALRQWYNIRQVFDKLGNVGGLE